MTTLETLQKLQLEVRSGSLANASLEELERYSAALCDAQAALVFAAGQFSQVCETVHLHLLHAHIDTLNRKNAFMQRAVIALAVACVFGTTGQIWHDYMAEVQAQSEPRRLAVPPHGMQQSPSLIPSPRRPGPSDDGAKKQS